MLHRYKKAGTDHWSSWEPWKDSGVWKNVEADLQAVFSKLAGTTRLAVRWPSGSSVTWVYEFKLGEED